MKSKTSLSLLRSIYRVIPLQQFMDSVVDRYQWLTKNATVQVSPLVWIDFTIFSAYIVIYKIYIYPII